MKTKPFRTPLHAKESHLINALQRCTFLPGAWDKKFIRTLKERSEKGITEKEREQLHRIAKNYRRQLGLDEIEVNVLVEFIKLELLMQKENK